MKLLYEVPKEIPEPNVDLFGEQLLRIQYEREGQKFRTGIFFHRVAVVQIRNPVLFADRDKDGTMLPEALYEFDDPSWKQAMLANHWDPASRDRKHHYGFSGYDWGFEFLADSWELLPERDGWETDDWFATWHRLHWSR